MHYKRCNFSTLKSWNASEYDKQKRNNGAKKHFQYYKQIIYEKILFYNVQWFQIPIHKFSCKYFALPHEFFTWRDLTKDIFFQGNTVFMKRNLQTFRYWKLYCRYRIPIKYSCFVRFNRKCIATRIFQFKIVFLNAENLPRVLHIKNIVLKKCLYILILRKNIVEMFINK